MSSDVIVCRFPVESAAYQVFSEIKQVPGIRAAAVVARDENGSVRVPEYVGQNGSSSGFWSGSLIGALVGVLGGPLGVLMGWSAGALVGSSFDMSDALSDAADDTDAVALLAKGIEPGQNVLIADADPDAAPEVDRLVAAQNGTTTHIPEQEVAADVANAREAAAQAAKAARAHRRTERREEFESKLRDLFHRA